MSGCSGRPAGGQLPSPSVRSPQTAVAIRPDRSATAASCTSLQTQMSSEEKEWMVISTTADYHEMFRLLTSNARLAQFKDISNGYTALHWASKLGQSEVVKMLAGRTGVNVNQRSHGGYTPMHLAAMHRHVDIVELLLNVYKADPNIRDNSGRKAWQYLQHSASADATGVRSQQYLFYSEDGWDVIISPDQAYSTPLATHTVHSNSNSSSSSLTLPAAEGIDVIQDGQVSEAEDWVFV